MNSRQATPSAWVLPSAQAPLTHAGRGRAEQTDGHALAGLVRERAVAGDDAGAVEYASWLRLLRASAS